MAHQLQRFGSRGLALIISNDYTNTPPAYNLEALTGTAQDAQQMNRAFKALNFDTVCQHNVNREQLLRIIHETARCTSYPESYKAIAVVFSGHGQSSNTLYMQDGSTVSICKMVEPFFPKSSPMIGNIPKLFFIDACRGERDTKIVTVPRGVESEVMQKGGNEVPTMQVPDEGNFLIAHSTMPNYRSYEQLGKGGIWMSTLAKKLETSQKSVVDILTEVNQELMELYQSRAELRCRMQQPEMLSRLNTVLHLHRGDGSDAVSLRTAECDTGFNDETTQCAQVHSDDNFQGLRPLYETYEDHSREQSKYKCTAKVMLDCGPMTVTGGFSGTSASALQETKKALAAKMFFSNLQSRGAIDSKRDWKSVLEQYYKSQGNLRPDICYKTRDQRGYQSTVFAPGMGFVKGDSGCRSQAAAEQSAAFHMLKKIQDIKEKVETSS